VRGLVRARRPSAASGHRDSARGGDAHATDAAGAPGVERAERAGGREDRAS